MLESGYFFICEFFLTFDNQTDSNMKRFLRTPGVFFMILLLISEFTFSQDTKKKEIIYVGTFSERGSLGIYVYELFRENMRFDLLQTIGSKASPSYIDTSPDGKFLFSANRGGLPDKMEWGSVTSFAIHPQTGKLSKVQEQYSYGDSPCYVSAHPSGKYIFVCHYRGGNFVVLPVDENGKIGTPTTDMMLDGKGTVMPQQSQAHPHSAVSSADGKFLYVSDLGQDKIFIYKFNSADGTVTPADTPSVRTMAGAGPRHFVLNPKGDLAYSSEELSSSVSSYRVNKLNGELQLIQRLPALPEAFYGSNSGADIHTAHDGKFVYMSNRGYNGLAIFKVTGSGKMQNIGYMPTIGQIPRGFMPDPKGKFMLVGNQDSDEINIFTLEKDGTLRDTNAYLPVPSPVCFKFVELK
jgi:6-phosphogluconolactonase